MKHSVYDMPRSKLDPNTTFLPKWCLGLAAAVIYGTCSFSMAFANKGLLTSYNFQFQATLMVIQMTFTLVALEVMRFIGIINIPRYSLKHGYSFMLPSLFYAINSVMGLRALTGMNIPMYSVIKRCTPAVCLLLRPFLLTSMKAPTVGIIASVVMVTVGCVLAAYGDLTFDIVAYSYGLTSVLVQSLYLTLVQRSSSASISTTHSLYLNAYNTLPFLFIYATFSGELQAAADFPDYSDAGFIVLLLAVVTMGCMLNYTLFLCTIYNSAVTTTVVGGMKSLAQTVIGIFTFGGLYLNVFNVFGLAINASGGLLYAFFKFRQREK